MPAGLVSHTTLRLLAAELGPESPLPPFTGLQQLPDPSSSPDLPLDMRERIAYGQLANPLPYGLQNAYRRDLRPQDISAIQLTNGRLEALILPGLGGRLWSLRDLVADRDLVFTNRRLQFANFALTDAWFAGGIEWNLGSTGHAATTCRPVFAGSVPSNRGAALRIWEWERTRDLVFSVDLLMPADRPLLLAFVRVRNPDPEPKPLYWWTNIATAEEPGVRVLAPAARAWRTGYDGSIAGVDIPFADDPAIDVSYPLPAQRAADYFFQVPSERRPWIAAVQADGRGLMQTSTAQLRGRKLFCWGTAAGRSALAGVALRARVSLPGDPGWSGHDATRAPAVGGEGRDQLGGGLRADRSVAGGGTRFLAGRARRGGRAAGPSGSRRGARRMAPLVASRGRR